MLVPVPTGSRLIENRFQPVPLHPANIENLKQIKMQISETEKRETLGMDTVDLEI